MYFICQNAPEFERCAQQAALLQKQLTAVRERVRFFYGVNGKIDGGYHKNVDALLYFNNGTIMVYRLCWGGYPHINTVRSRGCYTEKTLDSAKHWLSDFAHSVSFEKVQKAGFDFTPLIKEMEDQKCLYLT